MDLDLARHLLKSANCARYPILAPGTIIAAPACNTGAQLPAEATDMDIGVEISLYPLHADFVPMIREFLERLNRVPRLRIVTNSMSTQVFGTYEEVMAALHRELRTTFEALGSRSDKAVFVMKVLGPLSPA
jgi:uncharacterized protein YqgV (UPF0045/DUF77 family)